MRFEVDDLSRPVVRALIDEHLGDMHATSPPESIHALDHDQLQAEHVTFFTVWDGDRLLGCGALKQLSADHGEIKTMRTTRESRRRGVGAAVLAHLLTEARRRGYRRVSLETGSQDFFAPARRLYVRHGFIECPPFADYRPDPNSVFMTLAL
jgi:putative acetyltransferase